ncbi:MAG: metalloregulator ArsR/SmtB family transcription factor [Rothia sp. (in: high G+C Gram-positive bacteria)]|nr:metalloregulator ArsR/SmtB family transcription factor [Rothia sp. (in: high G+C Gram-positive bacteria)]
MKDDIFAVIADPTRRHILQALATERLAVGELVEELSVSQPTVSKHLKVLRLAGLVETEAVGQKRFYSITPQPLTTITNWARNLIVSPATDSAPSEATAQKLVKASTTDGPRPITAGITFTPLAPFTPTLSKGLAEEDAVGQIPIKVEYDAAKEQDTVSEQVRLLAQGLSLGAPDEGPLNYTVSTSERIPQQDTVTPEQGVSDATAPKTGDDEGIVHGMAGLEEARQMVAESEERAQVADAQAHQRAGAEENDDRGLLAKLTRWGRRSSR